jgi:hypothetical protein
MKIHLILGDGYPWKTASCPRQTRIRLALSTITGAILVTVSIVQINGYILHSQIDFVMKVKYPG